MITDNSFDYIKFISLSEAELCAYMEHLLQIANLQISDQVLEQLFADLLDYDEYHFVYALLLGVKGGFSPFVRMMPSLLADKRASVVSTAINTLNSVEPIRIDDHLLYDLQKVRDANPDKPWIADMYFKLSNRHRQK